MLSSLKNIIRQNKEVEFLVESVKKNLDDSSIRDAMLDDTEVDIELDDSVKKIIDSIPEYDEEKDMTEQIKNLQENLIPETFYKG